MHRTLGRSALTLVFLLGLSSASPAVAQSLEGRFLDAAIDSIVAEHLSSGSVAGLTVAVARGGQLLHHEPYGMADVELDVRTPRDAVYEIGSVTKQFTSVLVLQLVGEGLLDLDEDIRTYYPEFDTGGRMVSLRRLLDHTSGMRSYTEMQAFGQLFPLPLPQDSLLTLVEQEPWDFEPGEALIYNNSAYFLVGLILEEVTGTRYAQLVEERLFEPLGMEASHYCNKQRVVPNMAKGYGAGPGGILIKPPTLDHRWPYAAGSLCSTAADLVRWNQALHGGEVLSPELYELLITPEPLNDGTEIRYAKGVVNEVGPYGTAIHHGGGIFGYLSEASWWPDDETVIVVLQNTTSPDGPGQVLMAVADLLRPSAQPETMAFDGRGEDLLGQYSGAARGTPMTVEVISADGGEVRATVNGGDENPMPYVGDGFFQNGGNRVWFLDAQGRRVGTPGAGPAVEARFDSSSAHYVLVRQDD